MTNKLFRIIVACQNKIYVFNFSNFQIIETLETYENPNGKKLYLYNI